MLMFRIAVKTLVSLSVSAVILWPMLFRSRYSIWWGLALLSLMFTFLLVFLIASAAKERIARWSMLAFACSGSAAATIVAAEKKIGSVEWWHASIGLLVILWIIVLIVIAARWREISRWY